MEWMIMPFKRYADFSGRSRRKEYWMFTLFWILVVAATFAVSAAAGGFDESGEPNPFLWGILGLFIIVSIIPSIAVTVRRFHDQDKSGWFYLLGLIPYIGGIILFVFMCIEGTRGSNQYGPDPKADAADIFG